jgi:peptide/nickel transport system permease protein
LIKFLLVRVASMIGIVLLLVFVMFVLQRVTPVDPVRAKLGSNASKQAVATERHRLGYDDPLPVQYVNYVDDLVHGNLQESLRTRRPVVDDIGAYLPATMELAFFGLVFALIMGGALGIASAAKFRGSGVFRVVLIFGASAPVFLLALLGLILFYRNLGWLPATGRTSIANAPDGPTGFLTFDGILHGRLDVTWDAFQHLLMPALCIAIGSAVAIGRVLRGSLIGNLHSDYIRTARAKGLRERTVMFKHALRNSVGPALSMTGLQVGLMFAGVVVVETIFAWGGLGQYIVQSIPRADFPAIAGVTLLLGVGYVVINTIIDILQSLADPRIRL